MHPLQTALVNEIDSHIATLQRQRQLVNAWGEGMRSGTAGRGRTTGGGGGRTGAALTPPANLRGAARKAWLRAHRTR